MANYQRRNLATGEDVGEPGPLPSELEGLADLSLADLSWVDPARGFAGTGFFRVNGRWIHKAIFKRRFTQAERIAIRAAEASELISSEERAALTDFREVLDATEKVYLDDPDVIAGLAFLVALGLLGELRPAQIRE